MRPAEPCKNGHIIRRLRCMTCMGHFCPQCQPKFKKRCQRCVDRLAKKRGAKK